MIEEIEVKKEPFINLSNLFVLAMFIVTINAAYLMPLMIDPSIDGAPDMRNSLNSFSSILVPLSVIWAIVNAVVMGINGSNRAARTAFVLALLPVIFFIYPLTMKLANLMFAS